MCTSDAFVNCLYNIIFFNVELPPGLTKDKMDIRIVMKIPYWTINCHKWFYYTFLKQIGFLSNCTGFVVCSFMVTWTSCSNLLLPYYDYGKFEFSIECTDRWYIKVLKIWEKVSLISCKRDKQQFFESPCIVTEEDYASNREEKTNL